MDCQVNYSDEINRLESLIAEIFAEKSSLSEELTDDEVFSSHESSPEEVLKFEDLSND